MRLHLKRTLISMLVCLTILPSTMVSASSDMLSDSPTTSDPVPDQMQQLTASSAVAPLFKWSFHPNQIIDKTSVVNSVYPQASAERAELKGVAAIVYDDQRGEVLSLSGVANGSGWLKLPDQIYSGIKDEMSIAFWAKLDTSTNSYSRLLSSTIAEKGLTSAGVSGWQDSEFIIIAGGGTFNNRIYTGTNPKQIASYKGDIIWNSNPTKGKWQQIVVTMKSNGAYDMYMNGVSVGAKGLDQGKSSSGATMASVLEHFFSRDYLDALKFNDFGRSLYTSDGDVRGKFDDLRIYNVQLNANQVSTLYEETKHEEIDTTIPAKISVDLADRSLGPVFHGASGALYALSEPNVPDINTLIPIKPSHISQKPPNGIQHPTGDALRVSDYFFEAGGEAVNIVLQDYYQHWYYPSRTAEEYISEAIIPIVTAVKEYKKQWAVANPGQDPDKKFIYIPFNEPEQNNTRYPQLLDDSQTGKNSRAVFNNDWLKVTKKIKEIDPGAVISGMNLTQYGARVFEDFIPFCVENDSLPDIISWHMLWNKAFNQAPSNVGTFRAVEAKSLQRYKELYPDRKVPFPIKVDINEYAATSEIAVGGSLIHYIAHYDELKMNSMLPYWNTANSYGSLLAGQNEPNGAWWLYKWYADMMGGDMAKINVINDRYENDAFGPGLYGLSSIQDNKKQVSLAFGGTQGKGQIVFNHVTGDAKSPSFLTGADEVHVTVWHAGYTGLTGFLVEPTQIIDRNYPVKNGSVTLDVKLNDYTSAYFAVITPAVTHAPHELFFSRLEAENAEVRTNVATVDHYPRKSTGRSASNGQYVEGIKAPDSLVKWTQVTVPADGNYRLDLIGGSGATATMRNQANTGDANQRINSEWFLKIDNLPATKVVLRADYNMQLMGGNTTFADLTKGTHSISISKYNPDTGAAGKGESTLDALELTYNGELGSLPNYRIQAEFAEYEPAQGLSRDSSLQGFEGAGYLTGYGNNPDAKTRFVVSVLDDGMYDLKIRYASSNGGSLQIDHDRKHLVDLPVSNTNGQWQEAKVHTFLRKGINLVDVRSTADLSLDYIDAAFVNKTTLFSIEAEDAVVVGTPVGSELPLIRDDAFAIYASGGKYVNGITSYDGAERYLELQNITVPKAGTYKLVVTYANGESAGTHAYNNDAVERYAQISVNGKIPQTVYFKNTISWQQFATQTFDVELQAGTNTIRFSNNNTYNGGSNPYGGTGAQGFTPYTAVPRQYAPAFDRFDIYPQQTLDNSGNTKNTVSFDRNGGDTAADPAEVTVDAGKSLGALPTPPTRAGYLFTGWNLAANGSGAAFTAEAPVEANLTVYAQWRVVEPGEPETQTGSISGTVTDGSLPVAGAIVTVSGSVYSAITNTAGGYTITDVPEGKSYIVIASKAGYLDGSAADITVKVNEMTGGVNIKLAQVIVVKKVTVSFNENGGDTAASPLALTVKEGESIISLPSAPTRTGYSFMGWNTAADGSGKSFSADMPVSADLIVYAQWQKLSTPTPTPVPTTAPTPVPTTAPVSVSVSTSTPTPTASPTTTVTPVPSATTAPQPSAPVFSDITQHWAKTSIQQAVELGIAKGYPDGFFKPNGQINRAEFASMLVRAMKQGTSNGELAFVDKDSTPAWASASIRSAVDAGWIKGFEDNSFRPLQKVTRIEMTVMAVRALGLDIGSPEKLTFADAKDIPAWANAYVAAAVKAGIVKGGSDNRFNPGAAASRAESIVLLMNMLDYNSNK